MKHSALAVVSGNGEVKARINPRLPLKPASNMKLLTTAASLHYLGTKHQFKTQVFTTAPIHGGVVRGDLYIRGTGDPNISGRFYNNDPAFLLRDWAKKLRRLSLKTIKGDLIVDDSFFTGPRFLPTWDRNQEKWWYCAQISALSLNDNCLDITVTPTKPGSPAEVSVKPGCDFVTVSGSPVTVSNGRTAIRLSRKTGTNQVTVGGKINKTRKHWKGYVTVNDPAMFFAHTFAHHMKNAGISIEGKIQRIRPRPNLAKGKDKTKSASKSRGRTVLVEHTSTLLRDLPVINKRSQNLHAETLLRVLGARVYGTGSTRYGAKAVLEFLREKEIKTEKLKIADGSGLSHSNRLTAHSIACLLHSVRAEDYADIYKNSLSIAGEDGTLEKKKRFHDYPGLRGRVYAKTGYIYGVCTLSGYVERGKKMWSFSILLNKYTQGLKSARKAQERIVAALYKAMGNEDGK